MSRYCWLFLALVALIAAYLGSYVYLVNQHFYHVHYAVDMGAFVPQSPVVSRRLCYSENPRIDSICKPIFWPLHCAASKIGLQRTEYFSAEDRQQEFAVFSLFVK